MDSTFSLNLPKAWRSLDNGFFPHMLAVFPHCCDKTCFWGGSVCFDCLRVSLLWLGSGGSRNVGLLISLRLQLGSRET